MKLRTVLDILMALALVVMGASAIATWLRSGKSTSAPQQQFAQAPQIKEVQSIKTVTVPGPTKIVTIDKPVLVRDLKLPDEIAKDEAKQITATAAVGPYAGKTDAISVIDTKTGASEIELKQEPLPFFAFENQKEVGARAGMTVKGLAGAAYARWTFLRTGQVHYAVYGEATSPPYSGASFFAPAQASQGDGKLMFDVSYRW